MKLPLSAALLVSGILSAADPQLMNLVMPEAKILAGINVQQATGSPFGQYLLSQAPANNQGLQQLIDSTGFDPRRDLKEILLASTGDPGSHKGLALVRGSFDVARILRLAQNTGQTPELYQGVQMIGETQNTNALAFLDGTLAVAGDATLVRGAIDRRSVPAALDPLLVAKADALSKTQAAWFVSLVPGSTLHPKIPADSPVGPPDNVLQKIQQASGGVQLGANVLISVDAVAATNQDASALADVIRFFASIALYGNQNQNPNQSQAAALLQNLSVKTAANVTSISLSISENQLEQLAQNTHHSRSGEPRLRQAPPRQRQ
jgi:hypothetical protein